MLMILKKFSRQTVNFNIADLKEFVKTLINKQNKIKIFEKIFSEYLKVKNIIFTSSARIALYVILKALNFKENTEILLPDYIIPVVPKIVSYFNLIPVFVEVDKTTNNIDPSCIQKKITKRTKAIIVAHIHGQPCNLDEILKISKENNLILIEDCAQACGASYKNKKVGSFGDISYFSFAISKPITALRGGAIATNNGSLNDKFRRYIRDKEVNPSLWSLLKRALVYYALNILTYPYVFAFTLFPIIYFFKANIINRLSTRYEDKIFLNSSNSIEKFTDAQAAISINQLDRLDKINKIRIRNAKLLTNKIHKINNIILPPHIKKTKHVYFNYVIKVKNPNLTNKKLMKYGVDSVKDFTRYCSNLPMFSGYNGDYTKSKKIDNMNLYIPLHQKLKSQDIKYIADSVIKVIDQINRVSK